MRGSILCPTYPPGQGGEFGKKFGPGVGNLGKKIGPGVGGGAIFCAKKLPKYAIFI